MNDRFKFRVWDKSAEQYVPRSQFILLSDGTLIQEIGGEEVIWESTQPEFCTGLKDKNGKLIYEGDVVQMSYPYSSQNKYIVKWGDCCWELWLKNGFVYVIYEKMSQSMEVIGNIHENADLLKGEK